ncbi:MAG: hypothetical protein IKQ04_01995, partial [Oscillospiraceae bacterium]|nr:hypothetical protein [Oscillospiraceae bacterium]
QVCHCETSPQTGRGPSSASPSPPSQFPMFSNRNLKTPDIFNFQLSIFNSKFARGRVHVAVNDRRYGGVRGTAGGQ